MTQPPATCLIILSRGHATSAAASLQFCSMLTVSLSRAGVMQPRLQLLCSPPPCQLLSEITASAPVLQLFGVGPHSCSRPHSRRRQSTPQHRKAGGSTGNLPQTFTSSLGRRLSLSCVFYSLDQGSPNCHYSKKAYYPLLHGWEQLFWDPPACHHRHATLNSLAPVHPFSFSKGDATAPPRFIFASCQASVPVLFCYMTS